MALKVNPLQPEEDLVARKKPIADKDYYLDEKGKVIPAGESARSLLVRKGREFPPGFAKPATKTRKGKAEDKAKS